MTGPPGDRTMDMNGGSSASYLARSHCVAVFWLVLIGPEAKGLLALQGRRGIASVVRWNPHPAFSQGKQKHININKFAGLCPDWVGAKILFMCFFSAHSLWARKNT